MTITAAQVKELRERTGAGMMECKKALVETSGDIEKAIEVMRKAGQAKAAKKAGRIAAEGVIAIRTSDDGKTAVMLEVNSETDFAAKDASFKKFVDEVSSLALEARVENIETLLNSNMGNQTVAAKCEALVVTIGENIQLRRVCLLKTDAGIIATYNHGGKIGVMVNLSVADVALGKDTAMHIAANKPIVVNPEDVPENVVASEKDIYLAQAEQSGKPKEIIEKMTAGRLKKFMSEVSLLGQPFVKDPSITVADLLRQHGAEVVAFVRYEVGEGIEKEETDFAAEVMAQVKG